MLTANIITPFTGARGVQQGRVDEDDQARHAVDVGLRGLFISPNYFELLLLN